MTFGATTRADMNELLVELTGGPLVDAYGTSCFQAVNRNDSAIGAGPVATALSNGVKMGAVVKPDFMQAAMRTNSRLTPPKMQPDMQMKPKTPAFAAPAPLGL